MVGGAGDLHLGKAGGEAFATLLAFAHPADIAQLMSQHTTHPHPRSSNDCSRLLLQTEASGDKWRPVGEDRGDWGVATKDTVPLGATGLEEGSECCSHLSMTPKDLLHLGSLWGQQGMAGWTSLTPAQNSQTKGGAGGPLPAL